MFISFEAMDGAGKSTQARRLADTLNKMNVPCILTREPGGSPGAEDIRRLLLEGHKDRFDPETELLMFNAARRDHILRTIQPSLDAGKVVVSDRYVGSTRALQVAGGTSREKVDALHEMFCGLMPDLTIFLDIDPLISLERSLARLSTEQSKETRFESKGKDFHLRVHEQYLDQLSTSAEWVKVNGSQSIDAVANDIFSVVTAHPKMQQRLGMAA